MKLPEFYVSHRGPFQTLREVYTPMEYGNIPATAEAGAQFALDTMMAALSGDSLLDSAALDQVARAAVAAQDTLHTQLVAVRPMLLHSDRIRVRNPY